MPEASRPRHRPRRGGGSFRLLHTCAGLPAVLIRSWRGLTVESELRSKFEEEENRQGRGLTVESGFASKVGDDGNRCGTSPVSVSSTVHMPEWVEDGIHAMEYRRVSSLRLLNYAVIKYA